MYTYITRDLLKKYQILIFIGYQYVYYICRHAQLQNRTSTDKLLINEHTRGSHQTLEGKSLAVLLLLGGTPY